MSIQKHEWTDSLTELDKVDKDFVQFKIQCETYRHLTKRDAIAIAKHFNKDRESLVLKIKGLIERNEDSSDLYASEQFYNVLEELKELIKEETDENDKRA